MIKCLGTLPSKYLQTSLTQVRTEMHPDCIMPSWELRHFMQEPCKADPSRWKKAFVSGQSFIFQHHFQEKRPSGAMKNISIKA